MDPTLVQGMRKKQLKSEPPDHEEDEDLGDSVANEEEEDSTSDRRSTNIGSFVSHRQNISDSSPVVGNFSNLRSATFHASNHDGREEDATNIPPISFPINHIQNNAKRTPEDASGIFNNTMKSAIISEHVGFHPYGGVPGHNTSLFQRPSVIRRAGREDSSKLQLQADILKYHGNILTHTGNLFSYHAELLNQKQNLHGTDNTKDTHEMQYNAGNHQYPKIKNEPESFIKKEFLENSKQTSDENEEKFEDIADKVFEEAQELLVNSPWILAFDQSAEQANSKEKPFEKDQILTWLQDDTDSQTPPPFHSMSTSSQSCQTSVIQKK